ncbi:MAG: septum formation initiator family protein, partial [Dehalococcoidia bacterium]
GLLRPENLPVVLIVATMIVGIAALLPLVQSSASTSTAGSIRQLEEERIGWQTQLQELELDVASMGSLDAIEREARRRFKMIRPEEVVYILVDSPPPEARRIPSRYLPQDSSVATDENSSVWEDLISWLPLPWD